MIRRMLSALLLGSFITAAVTAVDLSTMEEFHRSPHFIYFAEADEDYSELIETVELRDLEFQRKFGVELNRPVEIYVFRDQESFAVHVFGESDMVLKVTGLADHVNSRFFITSYHDDCKPRKRLLLTPVHELVHIYYPHNYIYIREGVACYFSDMLYPMTEEDIPRRFTDIRFYVDGPEETAKAYNAGSWMMKYIYEECLAEDMRRFRAYTDNPEDYRQLGFENEEAFFAAWGVYLQEEAVENHG